MSLVKEDMPRPPGPTTPARTTSDRRRMIYPYLNRDGDTAGSAPDIINGKPNNPRMLRVVSRNCNRRRL